MKAKGIVLYSGGLDSMLTAKILLDQGIEMLGVNFVLPFFPPHKDPSDSPAGRTAAQIGLTLRHVRVGMDYMKMVENPPNGWGKNINPCVDCKIFFQSKAGEIMRAEGYDFVATGEVRGQRPMSQRPDAINKIENSAGMKGNILRPLSAHFFPPTEAEKKGLVDRSKLLHISGRGRTDQMELAKQFGFTSYESPSGGCRFTDAFYSSRLRDLFKYHPEYTIEDVYLLAVGRHYRISPSAKILIARNGDETELLLKYKNCADTFVTAGFQGPAAIIKGIVTADERDRIASMILRHGKPNADNKNPVTFETNGTAAHIFVTTPESDDVLNKMRI
jgi:tRNA-uridine 2-sulfurtransferase